MLYINQYQNLKLDLLKDKITNVLEKIVKKTQPREAKRDDGENDEVIIVDVKLDEYGTVNTYVVGEEQPFPIYPRREAVDIVAIYKKLFSLIARELRGMNWFKRIITVLFLKYHLKTFSAWFSMMFLKHPVLLNDNNYSLSIREVRRVLKGLFDDELLDAMTIPIEIDNAYKNRVQAVLQQYDKNNKNIRKEILRLFDVDIGREKLDGMKEKIGYIKKFVNLVLFFSPKLKKQLKKSLDNLDLDKIKFREHEYYWALKNKTFNFDNL